MIPILLAALLQAAPDGRGAACAALSQKDPAAAIAQADAWRQAGGGSAARQCLGLAYAAQERWAPAAAAFTQAAKDAELQGDTRAAGLWVQAGNASLAGGDAAVARVALGRAIAIGTLGPAQAGEAHLDRARAAVAAGDLPAARTDMDAALKLVPQDPMAWLLSATLARRQQDGTRAAKDIAEADRLAPNEPAVAYESGTIAMLNGLPDAARALWAKAAAAKDSPAGQRAAEALAANRK